MPKSHKKLQYLIFNNSSKVAPKKINLNCTALYFTVLHGTEMKYTALHCNSLHCTALHCTAPHFYDLE